MTRPKTAGRLAGKVALITGAASGLGRATAHLFAREGARVVATDIDQEGVETTIATIGEQAIALAHDVTDEGRWSAVMDEATACFGGLHILVNNAGIGEMATIEATTAQAWRRIHSVDLDGVFFGCRAAIAPMRASGGGAIVNISSVAGLIADYRLAAYCSAKAAVRHLTKVVALHCARAGYPIRCNSIHPAFIDTPILDDVVPGMPRAALIEALAKANPMGRVGDPDDVAYAALYLASDEAKFVNGAELAVDGGLSAE